VSCSGSATNCALSNQPPAPAAPAPDEVKLQQHAQAERCTFYFGGSLSSSTYSQSSVINGLNGRGNWSFAWGYTIAPDSVNDIDIDTAGVQVAAQTAWNSAETGGTVDVPVAGFISGESFLKQSTKNKYSFTMLENGVTRARNVSAQLQVSDGIGGWTNVGAPVSLNNVDTDLDTVNDGVAIVPAAADFSYFGNGGIFGNSAVYSSLHASGGKAANGVSNILNGVADGANSDNFAGNNNDLAAGNVDQAPFSGLFSGITTGGVYRTNVSGSIKGNGGAADFMFSVNENTTVIGGC
jgi:hypothetical protein